MIFWVKLEVCACLWYNIYICARGCYIMLGEKEIEFLNNLDINAFNAAIKDNQPIFEHRIERFKPFMKVLLFYYDSLPRVSVKNGSKDFSTQELIDTTLAFYKKLSPETYKRAKATLSGKTREVILHDPREFPSFDGERGKKLGHHRNSCGFRQGKKYIELEPESHLSGYVRVAHELGHACSQFKFKDNDWFKEVLLSEVDSRFAELLITDYLATKGEITEEERIDLINYFTAEQVEKLSYCICEAKTMFALMQIQEGGDITKQDLQEMCENMSGPIVDAFERLSCTKNTFGSKKGGYFEYELQYIVGTIVATKMFNEFKDDTRYMKWFDKNFLDTIDKLTFEEGIIYLGNRGMTVEQIKGMDKDKRQQLFGSTMNDMLAEHLAFAEDNNLRAKQLEQDKAPALR